METFQMGTSRRSSRRTGKKRMERSRGIVSTNPKTVPRMGYVIRRKAAMTIVVSAAATTTGTVTLPRCAHCRIQMERCPIAMDHLIIHLSTTRLGSPLDTHASVLPFQPARRASGKMRRSKYAHTAEQASLGPLEVSPRKRRRANRGMA